MLCRMGELCAYKSQPCVIYFLIKNQSLSVKVYVRTADVNQPYRTKDLNAELKPRSTSRISSSSMKFVPIGLALPSQYSFRTQTGDRIARQSIHCHSAVESKWKSSGRSRNRHGIYPAGPGPVQELTIRSLSLL